MNGVGKGKSMEKSVGWGTLEGKQRGDLIRGKGEADEQKRCWGGKVEGLKFGDVELSNERKEGGKESGN